MADGLTQRTKTVPTRERPLDLYGRVAIVTGAAKGMGGPICTALAEEGAALVLAGRDMDAIEAHAERLGEQFPDSETLPIRCDVTDEAATRGLAGAALDRFGRIDILVNTAGVIGPIETPAQDVPLEDFRFVLDVNVVGTFLPCKAVIPAMLDGGGGRLVNIAGTSGLRGYRNRVGYSSSKWAIRGMTRTLALELGPHDITVNAVCPNLTNGGRMDRILNTKAELARVGGPRPPPARLPGRRPYPGGGSHDRHQWRADLAVHCASADRRGGGAEVDPGRRRSRAGARR